MSWPSTWATPALGCRKPSSSRIVVDLPAPFGPRKPKISPGSTVRSRSASAGASWRPYCFVSPRVSMTAIEGNPTPWLIVRAPATRHPPPRRLRFRRHSHGAVPGGIEAETRAMLENVGRLLDAVGLSYADVVKCTVYLRDFGDFGAMNKVYREFFPQDAPTRATVGVTALAAD